MSEMWARMAVNSDSSCVDEQEHRAVEKWQRLSHGLLPSILEKAKQINQQIQEQEDREQRQAATELSVTGRLRTSDHCFFTAHTIQNSVLGGFSDEREAAIVLGPTRPSYGPYPTPNEEAPNLDAMHMTSITDEGGVTFHGSLGEILPELGGPDVEGDDFYVSRPGSPQQPPLTPGINLFDHLDKDAFLMDSLGVDDLDFFDEKQELSEGFVEAAFSQPTHHDHTNHEISQITASHPASPAAGRHNYDTSASSPVLNGLTFVSPTSAISVDAAQTFGSNLARSPRTIHSPSQPSVSLNRDDYDTRMEDPSMPSSSASPISTNASLADARYTASGRFFHPIMSSTRRLRPNHAANPFRPVSRTRTASWVVEPLSTDSSPTSIPGAGIDSMHLDRTSMQSLWDGKYAAEAQGGHSLGSPLSDVTDLKGSPSKPVMDRVDNHVSCREPRISVAIPFIKVVQTFATQVVDSPGDDLDSHLQLRSDALRGNSSLHVLDPESLIPLNTSDVLVRTRDEPLRLCSVAALQWSKCMLQPLGKVKDLFAVILTAPFPDHRRTTRGFFRGLQEGYTEQGLGNLDLLGGGRVQLALESILEEKLPWAQSADEGNAPTDLLSCWASISATIGKALASANTPPQRPIVIYFVSPSRSPARIWEHCTIYEHIRQSYVSERNLLLTGDARLVEQELNLRVIDGDTFLCERGPEYTTPDVYHSLAYETYQSATYFECSIGLPWERQLVVLAPRIEPLTLLHHDSEANRLSLSRKQTIHIAYSVDASWTWMVVAWTDDTGTISFSRVYSLSRPHRIAVADVAREIWNETSLVMKRAGGDQYNIYIVKTSEVSQEEITMWRSSCPTNFRSKPIQLEIHAIDVEYSVQWPNDTSIGPLLDPQDEIQSPGMATALLAPSPLPSGSSRFVTTTEASPASPSFIMSPAEVCSPIQAMTPMVTSPPEAPVSSRAQNNINSPIIGSTNQIASSNTTQSRIIEDCTLSFWTRVTPHQNRSQHGSHSDSETSKIGDRSSTILASAIIVRRPSLTYGDSTSCEVIRVHMLESSQKVQLEGDVTLPTMSIDHAAKQAVRSYADLWTLAIVRKGHHASPGQRTGPWHIATCQRILMAITTIFPSHQP